VLTALLVTSPLVQGQTETAGGKARVGLQEAGAKLAIGELHIPVTGMKKENETKVADALAALSTTTFVCPGCDFASEAAGRCSGCDMPLESKKVDLLRSAHALPGGNVLALRIHEGRQIGLKQIEESLRANAVGVDASKLVLSAPCELVVSAKGKDAVGAVQTALTGPQLYSEAYASLEKSGLIHVRPEGGATATRKSVETALATAHGTLSDVIWSGPTGKARS
jgi:hypothetical protein